MFSRVFGKGSIYETLDLDDQPSQRPYDLYNSNLTHDDPLQSGIDSRHEAYSLQNRPAGTSTYGRHGRGHTANSVYRPFESTLPNLNEEEGNDDVPGSLLIEDQHQEDDQRGEYYEPFDPNREDTMDNMERGMAASPRRGANRSPDPHVWLGLVDPKERALWKWANVENLDVFLQQVYGYYIGKGIYCIVLARFLNLATIAFVVGFSTFLLACIDWPKIPEKHKLHDIIIPHGLSQISWGGSFVLWSFALFWMVKFLQYVVDIQRLRELQNFYHYLLEIQDVDIQTISWQEVVQRIMKLRDSNPNTARNTRNRHGLFSKQRMDAHDIANRIMRKDNYFIAMINRDVLDLTVPVPILRNRPLFARTLEWNINLCIMKYVFDDQGQMRPVFIRDTHKRLLSDGLKRRFIFAGFMNLIFAPFIVIYLLLLYFFRYFEEYHKNPGALGSRQYKPFAQWKFREFNELYHIFKKRLDFSHKFASKYIDQFPKEKTAQISSFVAFISGSFAAVLFLVSLVDPELFLGFEITKDRTVLFYLGLFGTILAISRGIIPEENLVFEPEAMLTQVIEYTHYYPSHWNGRLHSDEVKREFSALYDLKIMVFLEEILSVLTTPFILWFSLPNCSDKVVDFFREFTVHVDGIGYVCSFAVFDFKRHGKNAARRVNRDDRTNRKMEQSMLNFRTIHPDWMPGGIEDDDSSAYVNQVNDPLRSVNAFRMGVTSPRNPRRPSQPYLGFAATSQLGQQSERRDHSNRVNLMDTTRRDSSPSQHQQNTMHNQLGFSPASRSTRQMADSELMRELEEGDGQRYDSELGDSFITPSQAVHQNEDDDEEMDKGNQGVLGLLNHLYQETGTGKGIGM